MDATATASTSRIGSATAASTSHSGRSVSTWWPGLRVLRRPCHSSCAREGVTVRTRLQKVTESLQIRAIYAVAREAIKKVREARVNGAAKVEEQRKLSTGERFDNGFNVGILVPNHLKTPNHIDVAGLISTWISALATAVLATEPGPKRQRSLTDVVDSKPDLTVLDSMRRGKLVEDDLVYRQMFVIRSYEAGFDKSASIETIANLFQETALNHVGLSRFVGDGMGTTHAMMRHRLIWVVTRMHVEVDCYPVWGDVVEIDSWVAAEGKNGMRRDFVVRDYTSGEVIARATSTWVMMNQDTRRLSKMPQEVLAEISPYFLDKKCIDQHGACQKIKKLNDTAPYIRSDLVPRLRDMDMNQHVNNVKYISWVLESVPQSLLVAHELASMTLEYRRECTPSDVVQSLSCPEHTHRVSSSLGSFKRRGDSSGPLLHGGLDGSPDAVSCSSSAFKSATISPTTTLGPELYTHLLRMQSSGADIVMGRTKWRVKDRYTTGPPH